MALKILSIIFTLVLSPLLITACTAGEPPALLRQEIAVTLAPDSHEVAGASTVIFKPRGAAGISFNLAPHATEVRCTIGGRPAPFTFAGGVLSVPLPALPADSDVSLAISYRSSFNDRPPADAVSGEDPTYGVKGVVSTAGVFLGPDAGWYPAPDGIPAQRSIRVTAPAGIEAITAGRRVSHSTSEGVTVSLWEEKRPAVDLALSAGPYRIDERDVDGIPLFTYFMPEDARLAARYLEASAKYIRFYEGLFGPYPFEKFAVVENFFPTGYGFPSYTLLGSTVIRLPFIPDTSLPHEIAHSWWGNGVFVDYRGGNWSEGLVTYLADYLLEERKSAAAGRDYRLRVLADYAALVPPDKDFPLRLFTGRVDPASRSIGYGKGAMTFHMARRMIGDEAFFRALHDISREKIFTRASWGDFLKAFSRTSGKDFTPFREEWLDRTGGPHLSFSGVTRRMDGKEWIVTGEVLQSATSYHLPVRLKLETAGSDFLQTLAIERERTPFSFHVPAELRRIMLDPDADLFRILAPDEIPLTVNRVKGSKSLLVIMTPSCRADRSTLDLLLESLDQQGAPIIAENEASFPLVSGHDLLFCGVPEKLRLATEATPVSVSREGFTIDRKTFERSDDALFLVTRHPSERDRVAALFFPLSAAAAVKCMPKITHYGRYGYLAFEAGENLRKGLTPASSAATDIIFDCGGCR